MTLSTAVKERLRSLAKPLVVKERKPMSNLITNRLLNAPFLSQIRSIQRTRYEKPERLVAWFRQLEVAQEWKTEYEALQSDEKDEFQSLQMAYEAIMERSFTGVVRREVAITPMQNAFAVLADYVKIVARKLSNGLMIVGPGGTGKSWTVMDVLRAENKKEGRDWFRIPGYSTPLALYNTLYQYLDKIIVFDDCDNIFADIAGLNILKGALDTLPTRKIAWKSTSAKVDIPEFLFKGNIIFISNMDPTKTSNPNFRALLTRTLTLLVGSSREEILMRMVQLLPEIAKDLTLIQQNEILIFLQQHYKRYDNLSLRLLVNMVALRKYSEDRWKELALSLS